MANAVGVVVVSGQAIFREGLRSIIESQAGYQVVGEAGEVREACELLDRVRFDLVVTDLRLPGTWGLALVSEMRRRRNAKPVLLLAAECTPSFVAEAFAAHCSGVVLASAPRSIIAEAVERVAGGLRYVYPTLPEHELQLAGHPERHPIATLSAREREVFELLVRDDSNQRAAQELYVSVKTIETHRTHIFAKLKVHSISELIRFAIRHGLIVPELMTEGAPAPVEELQCPVVA